MINMPNNYSTFSVQNIDNYYKEYNFKRLFLATKLIYGKYRM